MKILTEIYGIDPEKITNSEYARRGKIGKISAIGQKSRTLGDIGSVTLDTGVDPLSRSWDSDVKRMTAWQRNVSELMLIKDLIIAVGPGAGKSSPFKVAFFKNKLDSFLSGIKNPLDLSNKLKTKDFPRLVYIAPTRQLVSEFYGDMAILLIEILLKHSKLFNLKITYKNRNFTNETKNQIYTILKELITLQEGSYNKGTLKSNTLNKKPVDEFVKLLLIGTYEGGVKGFIQNKSYYNFVLVDELQEFLVKPGDHSWDFKKFNHLLNLIKNTPKQAKLHLMTGSVNKESLDAFNDKLRKYRKFEIINVTKDSFTTYKNDKNETVKELDNAQNRSDLIVSSVSKLVNTEEQIKLIKNAIRNKIPYNVLLLFGIKKPYGLFGILEEIVKTMPKRNHDSLFSDYKQTKGFSDEYDPKKPTTSENKWFSNFFNTSSDFIEKNPLPSSIIDEFKIPNIKIREDLILKEISPNEYEANLSKGQFFRSEIGNFILVTIKKEQISILNFLSYGENVTYGYLFQIKSVNYDDSATVIYHGSNLENHKLKDQYTFKTNEWMMYDSGLSVDETLVGKIIDELQKNKKNYGKYRKDEKKFGTKDVIVDDIEFLKYFDQDLILKDHGPETQLDTNELISKYDPDNLLYQGALAGVGLMIGKMHNRHKRVIQQLFRNGKIYFLIATDSIGVGANVLCKNLYIPKLQKRNNDSYGDINSSSLIQLVNRAGRNNKLIPQGHIYVNDADYDRVKRFIMTEPSIEIEKLSIAFIDNIK